MSRNKTKIVEALKARGFTDKNEPFQLFYWAKDGWYLHCDQCNHVWVGFNTPDVIREIKKGIHDVWINPLT